MHKCDSGPDAPPLGRSEWFQKNGYLASSVDERVFKLLRNLVKLEGSSSGSPVAPLAPAT
jgi:hypothetical protein